MKKFVSIVLALLILAVSAKDLLMWTSFKANQDFIAKVFCINKDKPEVMCNGKCYLDKKIAESKEEKKNDAPVPSPDESKQVVYFQEILNIEYSGPVSSFQKTVFSEPLFSEQAFLSDLFQPPRALCLSELA
ncbi:MAG: hypothetical protein R2830_21230 [Saprospiraceae bacterium]